MMARRNRRNRFGQRDKKGAGIGLYLLLAVLLGLGAAVLFYPGFERDAPVVTVELDGDAIGLASVPVKIRESGSGLDSVHVTLTVGNTVHELANERYAQPVFEKDLELELAPLKQQLQEGPALLTVTARDRSWWMLGNTATVQRKVQVDLSAPTVSVLSTEHYVNHGGSGMVIYSVSEPGTRNGVRIGNYFFPGTPGLFPEDPAIQAAVFAHPQDLGPDARPVVEAQDAAGNTSRAGFTYNLRDRRYRERQINISESFVRNVVLPLAGQHGDDVDLVAAFLKVNSEMRAENERRKREICSTSAHQVLWQGAFHQLSNSKVEANFADRRDYFFDGRKIDHQTHLGYDLAVTKRYPVEAANSGRVLWADRFGIYGNAVILDHGLGVCTLYAHLSSMDVRAGDTVEKKAILGRSGSTGLSGGDHLHYEVLVRGVPVLPLEWWDAKWIRDNIQRKFDTVRKELAAG